MITIKEKGKILRVVDAVSGNAVNASNAFEVSLVLQHWLHQSHGAACCPVCRV